MSYISQGSVATVSDVVDKFVIVLCQISLWLLIPKVIHIGSLSTFYFKIKDIIFWPLVYFFKRMFKLCKTF